MRKVPRSYLPSAFATWSLLPDALINVFAHTKAKCLVRAGQMQQLLPRLTKSRCRSWVSLPEIKSGRIDGANLRGVGWARYGQRPAQHATLVHPCSAIGACEHHCNIFGTIPAGGEDAARRRQRHGQGNPVESSR